MLFEFLFIEEAKHRKNEKGCKYHSRNKGELSGQVLHCNFYFASLWHGWYS